MATLFSSYPAGYAPLPPIEMTTRTAADRRPPAAYPALHRSQQQQQPSVSDSEFINNMKSQITLLRELNAHPESHELASEIHSSLQRDHAELHRRIASAEGEKTMMELLAVNETLNQLVPPPETGLSVLSVPPPPPQSDAGCESVHRERPSERAGSSR